MHAYGRYVGAHPMVYLHGSFVQIYCCPTAGVGLGWGVLGWGGTEWPGMALNRMGWSGVGWLPWDWHFLTAHQLTQAWFLQP